jgi:hypothetical protein
MTQTTETAPTVPQVFTMDSIKEFCVARDTGRMVEVDEELWYYFLEVLPPVHMNYDAEVLNARGDGYIRIKASFGFAEGYERVTAFWRGWGEQRGRYFCQITKEMNPRG